MTEVLPPQTWDDALERYVRDRGRLRYSTVKSHRSHLRTLAAQAPAGPWSLTPKIAASWMESRGPSRRNAWAAGRSFYNWASDAGWVAASPFPILDRGDVSMRTSDQLATVPAPWSTLLSGYFTRMRAAGRTAGTIGLHRSVLVRLARSFPTPSGVTPDDLAWWLAEQTWGAHARRSGWSICRGLFAYAVEIGTVDESPAAPLTRPKVPRGVARPASEDAFSTALARADDRQRLMLLLASHAGLRASEIAAVRPSTDVVDGFLYIVGKGGHERRVPVHRALEAELAAEEARRRAGRRGSGFRRYLSADAGSGGYLFPSPRGGHVDGASVSRVLGRALPGAWTAHTLRHRFASQVYAGTRDLRAVQELLGHASPATTARYTATTDESLRLAVGVLV